MEASRAVGVAGYIYVAPIALLTVVLGYFIMFRTNPNAPAFADLMATFDINLLTAKIIYLVILGMIALFLALPGLLLITIAEAAEQRARTNTLLANLASKMDSR